MDEGTGDPKRDLELVEATLTELGDVVNDGACHRRFVEAQAAVYRLRRWVTAGERFEYRRLEVAGLLGAGVAHELNNLLFVMRASAEMANLSLAAEDPIKAKLVRVEEAVDRAERLTRMVLQTARPAGGAPPSILLHPLVKEGLKLIQRSLGAEVRVHQDVRIDAPTVTVDPVVFFRVYMALLKNAAEALDGGRGGLSVTLGERAADCDGTAAEPAGSATLALTVAYAVGDIGSDSWHRTTETPGPGDEGVPEFLAEPARELGGSLVGLSLAAGGRRYDLSLPVGGGAPIR